MRFQSGYSDLNATDGERKPRSMHLSLGKDKICEVALKRWKGYSLPKHHFEVEGFLDIFGYRTFAQEEWLPNLAPNLGS